MRSLAESGVVAARTLGVEFVPVIVRGQRIYAARPQSASLDTRRAWWGELFQRLVARVDPRIVRRLQHYVRRATTAIEDWKKRNPGLAMSPDDILVLSGSAWNDAARTAVARARQVGIPVGVIIYDLIPVDRPEFFAPRAAAVFQEWIEQVTQLADFSLSISQATRDRMWHFARQQHPQRAWSPEQFRSFRLGSNIDTRWVGGRFRSDLKTAFDGPGSRTYLTVATIEPRKNHAWLLDAWDDLWRTHPSLRWCIVGRIGWLCEDLVSRIRNHPRFGQNLFMYNDLSESELSFCYRHARAFLFASQAEGFGLPIVEALTHGLPTFVSDIPVHREVGGDFCAYFDLASIRGLVSLITQFERAGVVPGVAPTRDFRAVDWNASALEFVRQSLDVARIAKDVARDGLAA